MKVKTVNVIRDARNARRDYELPETVALALYKSGELAYCATNGTFAHRSEHEARFPTQ